MNHMNISIAKSIIRMLACIGAIIFSSISVLAIGFLVAEILGILEEVFDRRKEV